MGNVVTILPDQTRIPVRTGETILKAATRFGFMFRVGCREGGCGVCKLDLVSGEVVYLKTIAQTVLSDEERQGGECLPCRAVPTTDVVIRIGQGDQLKRAPYSNDLVERALYAPTEIEADL